MKTRSILASLLLAVVAVPALGADTPLAPSAMDTVWIRTPMPCVAGWKFLFHEEPHDLIGFAPSEARVQAVLDDPSWIPHAENTSVTKFLDGLTPSRRDEVLRLYMTVEDPWNQVPEMRAYPQTWKNTQMELQIELCRRLLGMPYGPLSR